MAGSPELAAGGAHVPRRPPFAGHSSGAPSAPSATSNRSLRVAGPSTRLSVQNEAGSGLRSRAAHAHPPAPLRWWRVIVVSTAPAPLR